MYIIQYIDEKRIITERFPKEINYICYFYFGRRRQCSLIQLEYLEQLR